MDLARCDGVTVASPFLRFSEESRHRRSHRSNGSISPCEDGVAKEDVSSFSKRRPFQRRKFRSKKRKDRCSGEGRHRIDLKDWPSDVPLPSPPLLHQELFPPFGRRCERSSAKLRPEWKTPWESSLDESGASTDVGFSTSIASGLSWDFEEARLEAAASEPSATSAGSESVFVPPGNTRSAMVCGDRLATWRREESSPLFFMLALLVILSLAGLLSASPSALARVSGSSVALSPRPQFVPLLSSPPGCRSPLPSPPKTSPRNKSTLLFPSYELPVAFEIQLPGVPPKNAEETPPTELWTTYGALRRKTNPLRLTVFAVGAAVSVYAWQWF
eukprot:Gregarina_sp_Pseudo_9__2672@NODE_291_length_3272_cov_19_942468_g272_i0_p2_GENE_NODE_291_length_3272_cov_19_942468_g272_i0NODE_291_length_3272_cov_19_942468_g272_i0_p2_ORF_typecomplete_len330_score76_01_NODE_291_length_3272_cov_19_942468_g272_i016092598